MIEPNSTSFKIGKKLGYAFVTYVGIRITIKSVKFTLKYASKLLSKF